MLERNAVVERDAEMAHLYGRMLAWGIKFADCLAEAMEKGVLRVAGHMLEHAIRAD